ncbi:MAG: exodeoxyribonuclease VII large subunit [Planctomycetaceae bacterium]|nr:exodeoxyribonuclease VII large subunit [Planctomycetaceae bacterium]
MTNNTPTQKKILRLSAIANRIGQIINEKTSGKRFWMKAEVSSSHQNANGHTYFDFVEMQHGRQVAKLRGMIWRDDRARIEKEFAQAGIEFKLENGKEITTECTIEYHPVFGISVNVVDADPNFALGEIERIRRQMLLKLEKEGLFETNKQIPLPLLLKRIGVVTSKGSAGHQDFAKTIAGSKYPIYVKIEDARMQGHRTERTVLSAITSLENQSLDLIVVLRGGGSKLDLGALDNELIARKIASCSVPVWTAIGHEIDESVLDYVSHTNFKTPTAVAEEILNRMNVLATKNKDGLSQLRSAWSKRVTQEKNNNQKQKQIFAQRIESKVSKSNVLIQTQRNRLRLSVSKRVSVNERRRISQFSFSFQQKAKDKLKTLQQELRLAKNNTHSATKDRKNDAFQKLNRAKTRLRDVTKRQLRDRGLMLVSSRGWFSPGRILSKVNSNRDVLLVRAGDFKKRANRKITDERYSIKSKQIKVHPGLIRERLKSKRAQLKLGRTIIDSRDPAKNLKRGYALIFDSNSKLVTSIEDLTKNQNVKINLADGVAAAKIGETEQDDS